MPKNPDRRATYRKCKTPTLVIALQKAQGSPSGGSDIDTTLWRVTLDNPPVPNVTARVRGVTERARVRCHKMRRGYFRLGGEHFPVIRHASKYQAVRAISGVLHPNSREFSTRTPQQWYFLILVVESFFKILARSTERPDSLEKRLQFLALCRPQSACADAHAPARAHTSRHLFPLLPLQLLHCNTGSK